MFQLVICVWCLCSLFTQRKFSQHHIYLYNYYFFSVPYIFECNDAKAKANIKEGVKYYGIHQDMSGINNTNTLWSIDREQKLMQ
jgi:hypothetical protein